MGLYTFMKSLSADSFILIVIGTPVMAGSGCRVHVLNALPSKVFRNHFSNLGIFSFVGLKGRLDGRSGGGLLLVHFSPLQFSQVDASSCVVSLVEAAVEVCGKFSGNSPRSFSARSDK